MRILSNFNTNLEKELHADYSRQFGEDKVVTIHKSKLFYWRYIGLPLFVYVSLLIVSFYFMFREDWLETWMIWVYIAFFLFYAIILFSKISGRWMNYKLDFLIVTPKEIAKYDQNGIFNRQVEKLHADKIKSISIGKSWFLQSMFDIGSIVFLAEGDNDKGDVVMDFIDAIESEEKKIVHVLGLDIE